MTCPVLCLLSSLPTLCFFYVDAHFFTTQANQISSAMGAFNPSMFNQMPGGYPNQQPMYPQQGPGMPQGPGMGYPGGPQPGQPMPGYPGVPGLNPSMPGYPRAPSPNPSMPAYPKVPSPNPSMPGYGGGAPVAPAINVSTGVRDYDTFIQMYPCVTVIRDCDNFIQMYQCLTVIRVLFRCTSALQLLEFYSDVPVLYSY